MYAYFIALQCYICKASIFERSATESTSDFVESLPKTAPKLAGNGLHLQPCLFRMLLEHRHSIETRAVLCDNFLAKLKKKSRQNSFACFVKG